MSKQFYFKQFSLVKVHSEVLFKIVLFQAVLFSISTQFQCQEQFYFKQFGLA